MNKVKLFVGLAFLLAFAAGVSVGLAIKPWVHARHGISPLSHELNLTPEQEKQIEEIWSKIIHRARERHTEQRLAIEKEREEKIRGLLTDEQKAAYDAVAAEFREKEEELRQGRKAEIDQAVEATRALLSEPQRVKYEKLLEERKGPPPMP